MCVLKVSNSPMFLLDCETVATVWYLLYFISLCNKILSSVDTKTTPSAVQTNTISAVQKIIFVQYNTL